MLSILPTLLAQSKAVNNSEKPKNEIGQLLYFLYSSKKKKKKKIMNSENSKTSEPHRFKLDLTDKLNLKDPEKKHGFSQCKYLLNIKSEYNNNKFKISAANWNDT